MGMYNIDEKITYSFLKQFYYVLPVSIAFIALSFVFWSKIGNFTRKNIINNAWRDSNFSKDWWKEYNYLGKYKDEILDSVRNIYYFEITKKITNSNISFDPIHNNIYYDNLINAYFKEEWPVHYNIYESISFNRERLIDALFKNDLIIYPIRNTTKKYLNYYLKNAFRLKKMWGYRWNIKKVKLFNIFPYPRLKSQPSGYNIEVHKNIQRYNPLSFGYFADIYTKYGSYVRNKNVPKPDINFFRYIKKIEDLPVWNINKSDYCNEDVLFNKLDHRHYINRKLMRNFDIYDMYNIRRHLVYSRFQKKEYLINANQPQEYMWYHDSYKNYWDYGHPVGTAKQPDSYRVEYLERFKDENWQDRLQAADNIFFWYAEKVEKNKLLKGYIPKRIKNKWKDGHDNFDLRVYMPGEGSINNKRQPAHYMRFEDFFYKRWSKTLYKTKLRKKAIPHSEWAKIFMYRQKFGIYPHIPKNQSEINMYLYDKNQYIKNSILNNNRRLYIHKNLFNEIENDKIVQIFYNVASNKEISDTTKFSWPVPERRVPEIIQSILKYLAIKRAERETQEYENKIVLRFQRHKVWTYRELLEISHNHPKNYPYTNSVEMQDNLLFDQRIYNNLDTEYLNRIEKQVLDELNRYKK